MDPRIQAIRTDTLVGTGTCSTIDECYSDDELLEQLDEQQLTTPSSAVCWAYQQEHITAEQALNTRWGADSDPQLTQYQHIIQRLQR